MRDIKTLAMLKMEKILRGIVVQGKSETPYKTHSVEFLFMRLRDEIDELEIAIDAKLMRKEQVKEEIADCSNLLDFIFEAIQ